MSKWGNCWDGLELHIASHRTAGFLSQQLPLAAVINARGSVLATDVLVELLAEWVWLVVLGTLPRTRRGCVTKPNSSQSKVPRVCFVNCKLFGKLTKSMV